MPSVIAVWKSRVSQGSMITWPSTGCPIPLGLRGACIGPLISPHQFFAASPVPPAASSSPTVLAVMSLNQMLAASTSASNFIPAVSLPEIAFSSIVRPPVPPLTTLSTCIPIRLSATPWITLLRMMKTSSAFTSSIQMPNSV